MTPEGKVKAEVKRILKRYGIRTRVMNASWGRGRSGVHDFLTCMHGRFVSIECKGTPDDKLTPLQKNFAADVLEDGGLVFEVNCDSIEIFHNAVRKLMGLNK